ncbi:MAG: alpha/beta hydrolase, partial [Erysipelotrichaceae bacterium]
EDISKDLNKISCPTLLVWGNKDEQTPLWMGKKMEKQMPNAKLVVFQGDDHFAYFHQMRRFLEVCDCFLIGQKL